MVAETTFGGDGLSQLEGALWAGLPRLLAEVGDLLRDDWPEYAAFLDHTTSDVAEIGGLFLHRLLDTAQRGLSNLKPEPLESEPMVQMVFEQIGRDQCARGRDLTDLLTAYQVGARAAWRLVSTTALEFSLAPEVLSALADAVFVYVNQLSSASARGFVLEQSAASATRERLREELADLLLSDRAESAIIRAAAQRAGWRLPAEAAVVLVDPLDEQSRSVIDRLGSEALPLRSSESYGAIVASVGVRGNRESAARYLRGAKAVVGHGVPLTVLPASVRVAQAAMDLQRRGLIEGDIVFASDHLDTIIAQRDERLIAALRSQVLAPLDDLPPATRQRLVETLTSWLRHMGDRRAVASDLRVHPQTVRYRLGQLQEHFGDQLDSPRERARLFLALVWDTSAP